MLEQSSDNQVIELIQELSSSNAVFFDGEKVSLIGTYADQLSAYRAKRSWVETLETFFLLEEGRDLKFMVDSDLESQSHILRCNFLSACARYAFWRLTNEQAIEAQYILETAHIPHCQARKSEFDFATQLKSLPNASVEKELAEFEQNSGAISRLLAKILNSLR